MTTWIDAVRQGIAMQSAPKAELEFDRADLFEAVKAGLEGVDVPMQDFLTNMKNEFQQYSAANGKDTEQVLDALTDGLESLRADIESYVDRAADVTGKDEILEALRHGFNGVRDDVEKSSSNVHGPLNTPDLLDAMEKEFEHLRESLTKSMVRTDSNSDKHEILDAIRDISESRPRFCPFQ